MFLTPHWATLSHFNVLDHLPTFICLFIAHRVWAFYRGIRVVNHIPRLYAPFHPFGMPGALFSTTTWWNISRDVHWVRRSTLYATNEIVPVVPFLVGKPLIYVSNLDVARQIISGGNRASFPKPVWSSRALKLWGMNLFAAEAEVWRKHRRIMGPAFNNELYRLVWTETSKTYREMIVSEGWEAKGTGSTTAAQELTFKLALILIGKCAFGFSLSWDDPPRTSDGRESIQDTMKTVAETTILRLAAPRWVMRLPLRRIRECNAAYEAIEVFMKDQVSRQKQEIENDSRKDVLSLLIKANEHEESKFKLSDAEVIGDIFVILFAGHETTAHALGATLGLLAVSQDAQDEVFEQIKDVVGFDRDPEFDDYNRLNKVLAVFFEAIRLFPSGHIMPRQASEDVIIQVPNPRGQEGTHTMLIPKGQEVAIDVVGLRMSLFSFSVISYWRLIIADREEYNPRYFHDPMSFKPSRWHDTQNDSEEFTAFSFGPRACIGRKFATTEAVCFLTMLLRDWRVVPRLNVGESEEEWKARVLEAKMVMALGAQDVPVTFLKR
ncbi:hypothetical protein D9757_010213 [Collybiopsis confluens]|uniref:Cytochrome P450 n=1 Tax=Collybiopsis confluens TaxID=2823264 RepID=A0A8H5GPL8_9AGAR|nr:hypothetical protein D9757_010213 [Collybiopsis confluens]